MSNRDWAADTPELEDVIVQALAKGGADDWTVSSQETARLQGNLALSYRILSLSDEINLSRRMIGATCGWFDSY
jgi:hypothetical protein